jgi:hypothetical protein
MTAKPNGGQAIKGFAGVEVDDAADVLIGGPASGEGNLISGNSARGISIQGDVGDTCTVQGNLIGTDITGLAPLPNQIENVLLATLGEQSLVGGANPGEGNVIAGCSGFGLRINGGREQRVWGNLIGVGVDGVTAVPNGAGVGIQSADLNEIGAPGAGNVISGNSNVGIAFLGFNPDGNRIRANRIGTDSTGTVAVPNGTDGVNILTGVGNVIGGRASGEGNLISGNGETGIRIAGATAQGNVIEGNLIGTDVTGMAALGNGQFGVMITDSPGNHVGNPLPGGGNVISGNGLTANHGGQHRPGKPGGDRHHRHRGNSQLQRSPDPR